MNRPALVHPRRGESVANKFTQTVSILHTVRAGHLVPVVGLADLPCMYEPDTGRSGPLEPMQADMPAADKIVILGDYMSAIVHQDAILTLADGETKKRFTITKVAPGDQTGATTVLTVTPKK
jgi:hypothetical protein